MSINLHDILREYPHIDIADTSDNKEILDFYHQTELKAQEGSIIYQRGEDFFSFLLERSQHFLVLTLRDDNHKLAGIAVASYRSGHINGKLTTVGYLGDLRITLNRHLIREWRKFYTHFLQQSPNLKETHFCQHYQTAIMSTNNFSKNNLTNTKIPNLYYNKLASYKMINIIGRWGISRNLKNVRFASEADRSQLITFLKEDHQKRLFGHDWNTEFDRRLNTWENFKITDYIIATDANENITAVTSLWSPIKSKQIIIPRIPFYFNLIEKILKYIPTFQLKPLPIPNTPIDILYINQISFKNGLTSASKQAILKSIIELAFTRNFNMLAYCDFDRENLFKNLRGFITQKMPMALYSVHFKENGSQQVHEILSISESDLSPTFDMTLV